MKLQDLIEIEVRGDMFTHGWEIVNIKPKTDGPTMTASEVLLSWQNWKPSPEALAAFEAQGKWVQQRMDTIYSAVEERLMEIVLTHLCGPMGRMTK